LSNSKEETIMKTILTLAGSVLLAATLAACSPGINEGIGHRITFDSSGMLVHAIGRPDAHIGKDGSLAINDRPIDTTPEQRALLKDYYSEARNMMQSGKAVGQAGVGLAEHAIGNAIRHVFSGKSDASDKALDAQSDSIGKAADALCLDLQQLVATQKQIAAQLPAFEPYNALGDAHCSTTTTHTVAVSDGPGASTSIGVAATKPAAH